jgi:uncharacterized membrane protein
MSENHVPWLLEELPTLVSKGVLPTEAAQRVRQYYGESTSGARGRNRAVVLFSVLGAALVGSGVILLLAHNWEQLSRAMRTVLSFAPLVCAQAVAGWVLWPRRASTAWREGAGTALTLAIGATISLIAQTYNISGDFGRFMLAWTLLALPVVYLLDATMPAVLYLVGITVWSGDARFNDGHPLWFWLLAALVLPHLWRSARQNRLSPRVVVMCWTLALSASLGAGFAAGDMLSNWWVLIYAGLLAAMYLFGERWFGKAASCWHRPLQTVGGLGVFGLALLLSCQWPWRETVTHWKANHAMMDLIAASVWPITALLLWVESLARRRWVGSMIGAMPGAAALGYLMAAGGENGLLPATILFDLFLFVLGVGTLWRGLREDRLGVVNSGMLMLAGLIITRFFDSDLGFVVRGAAFIVVGVGFLVTNVILIRRKGAAA